MRDPCTDAEWREAVALAAALLNIDAARQYGLITGGPEVRIDRSVAILEAGRARSIVPTRAEVDQAIAVIARGES
jgi:hypothetical protein